MDVLTPKGQVTRQQEERAAAIWAKHFPVYSYVQTPKDNPAIVDAILSVDNVIKGVVETKCREYAMSEFRGRFESKWMFTYEKLVKCADIASGLSVPLIGFLYIVPEDTLLYQKLWEPKAGWLCDMHIRPVKMQATVNGGTAVRSSAFIDMRNASVLKGE